MAQGSKSDGRSERGSFGEASPRQTGELGAIPTISQPLYVGTKTALIALILPEFEHQVTGVDPQGDALGMPGVRVSSSPGSHSSNGASGFVPLEGQRRSETVQQRRFATPELDAFGAVHPLTALTKLSRATIDSASESGPGTGRATWRK